MKKIIVLQGPPASGKSTYARELAQVGTPYVIVNRDSIREARGEYWIPEQEDYISDMEEYGVRSAIKRKLIPIIDATNLNPKTIAKWENLAKELNCEYIATGHYANVVDGNIHRMNSSKDQSYFLYQINKEVIPHILFPLNKFNNKEEISDFIDRKINKYKENYM